MRSGVAALLILLPGCFPGLLGNDCPDCDDLPRSPNAEGVWCYTDGVCRECTSDAQCKTACGPDERCRPCDEALPCKDNLACVDGACTACRTDDECGPGRACAEGTCSAPCESLADCERFGTDALAGLLFDDRRGSWFGCRILMQEIFYCTGDGLYPDTLVCDPCLSAAGGAPCQGCTGSGDCPCAVSEDCPPGTACRAGFCGSCRDDAHCRDGEFCGEGTCRPKCTLDADCPGGRCAAARGACLECLDDADCPSHQRCYADGCVTPCGPTSTCFDGQSCEATGRCALCGAPAQVGPEP